MTYGVYVGQPLKIMIISIILMSYCKEMNPEGILKCDIRNANFSSLLYLGRVPAVPRRSTTCTNKKYHAYSTRKQFYTIPQRSSVGLQEILPCCTESTMFHQERVPFVREWVTSLTKILYYVMPRNNNTVYHAPGNHALSMIHLHFLRHCLTWYGYL